MAAFHSSRPLAAALVLLVSLAGNAQAQNFPSSVVNTVQVTAPNGSVVSASDTDNLVGNANLSVLKTQRQGNAGAFGSAVLNVATGSLVQFQIVVTNGGPQPVTSATFADAVPGNFTALSVVSQTGGNGATACSASFTGSNLAGAFTGPNGATCTVVVQGTASTSTAPAGVVNTATAAPPAGLVDPDGAQSQVTTVISTPTMSVAKTTTVSSIAAPGVIPYTIVVTNTGSIALTGVSVVDTLPGGGAGTVVLTGGDTNSNSVLDVGEAWTYTTSYVATQADIDAGVNLVNTVGVTTTEIATAVTSSATTTVTRAPSLTIVKTQTGGPNPVTAAGDVLTYEIEVANTGTTSLTGVVLSDALDGAPLATTLSSGDADNDLVLDVGETWVYTASYTVTQTDIDTKTQLVNSASVVTTEVPGPTPVTTPVTTPIASNPAISVVKSASLTEYDAVGQVITYTFVVSNDGNTTLTNIVVSDPMPGLSPLTCASPLPATLGIGQDLSCTATRTVTAADLLAGSLTNTATVQSTEVPGPVASNTVVVTVANEADVSVTKTLTTVAPYVIGQSVSYDIVVANAGPVTATNVVVTDIPSNLTLTSVSGAGCSAMPCTIPAIGSGTSVTITVVATIDAEGPFSNNASAAADQTDPVPANNSDSDGGNTTPPADLAPVAEDDTYTGNEGQAITGNVGGNDAAGNGASTWTMLTGPANGTLTLNADGSFSYVPNAGFVGVDTFTYQLCDVDGDCDTATVTLNLRPITGKLGLQKSVSVREVNAGQLLAYTLTITNLGDLPVVGVDVVDVPPAGFAFVPGSAVVVDADNAAVVTGTGPVTFAGIDIPVDGTATIRYFMRVGAGLVPGEYTNEATVYQGGVAVSNTAAAAVLTGAGYDPDFEQTRIWGKVFDDRNGDGWQDADERGIPGVRLATVEGLVAETDAHGRYHFEGLVVSNQMRGQNFVVKVDKATLPDGTEFTTANPLLRRITPAVPTRFDFGVRLPPPPKGEQTVTLELGTVVFAPGSREIQPQYAAVVREIADRVREHDGGEVSIETVSGGEALAFERAVQVRDALVAELGADGGQVRIEVVQPDKSRLLSVGDDVQLGAVLFDTDRATIRPGNEALLDSIAKALAGCGYTIVLTGHADVRGDADHNQTLASSRAEAVRQAIEARLSPEERTRLRVETQGAAAPGAGQ